MSPPVKKRKINRSHAAKETNTMEDILNLDWCKSDWPYPETSKDARELMRQCINLPPAELVDDVEDVIRRSDSFPIPFPLDTMRLKMLKDRIPESRLKRNITSTYTVIHERVLLLMATFLQHKREFGSDIEKALYKDMKMPEFVDRILKKRAVAFLTAKDKYKLLSGEIGTDGWESVGTPIEEPPLVLENCLSYDEMKLSAMVFVSGYTECINDGARKNSGVVNDDNIEQEAVIIGVIGSRFKREGRMDCEDILISKEHNTPENGYGDDTAQSPRYRWRKMWAEFFQLPSYTYDKLIPSVKIEDTTKDKQYMNKFVKLSEEVVFDNEAYYRRTTILIETALVEAEARGKEADKSVYLNIIGAGLGVWKASKHQEDVYIVAFLERLRATLNEGSLTHVTDVNFAYIKPGRSVAALFNKLEAGEQLSGVQKLFIDHKQHPNGGINVHLESREPTAKLPEEHAGKLLVITYPWDGNAHPGNEFWIGKLSSSGDPAAACSTQVSELHNAHINPALSGLNVRVAGPNGLSTLPDSCLALTA